MKKSKPIFIFILFFFLLTLRVAVFPSEGNVNGLEMVISKIDNFPLDKKITSNYDLYELYIENRSENTYSIPGYSINFGVNYFNILDLSTQLKSAISKKMAVLNLATGAVFIPFGSIARNAARTAFSSVSSFKKDKFKIYDNENLLSSEKTYILYPRDQLALYFLVAKENGSVPNLIRFVCKNEELNQNYVVINRNVEIRDFTLNVEGKIRKRYEDSDFPIQRQHQAIEEDSIIADPNELDLN